jgi:hypothetical protein
VVVEVLAGYRLVLQELVEPVEVATAKAHHQLRQERQIVAVGEVVLGLLLEAVVLADQVL